MLKPDGFFLGSVLGGDTLFELRTACQQAEEERRGGIAPRMSPLMHVCTPCAREAMQCEATMLSQLGVVCTDCIWCELAQRARRVPAALPHDNLCVANV